MIMNSTKFFTLVFFLCVNICSYYLIPYIIEYLHVYINALFIPDSFFWDGQIPRKDTHPRITAQVVLMVVEWIVCVAITYKLIDSMNRLWSSYLLPQTAIITIIGVAIITIVRISMLHTYLLRQW